jgi:hypothetical protein
MLLLHKLMVISIFGAAHLGSQVVSL